jgi:signal transduction histidine kinase
MSIRDWLRPPRHLIALFLLITLVPSVLLLAFGWQLIVSDRALRARQSEERLGQAADLVVAALDQSVAAAEQSLRDPDAVRLLTQQADAVAVVFAAERVQVFPQRRLPFYPWSAPGAEPPPGVFPDLEDLEYRAGDSLRAAAAYRRLAASPDAAVRAGALIRLGAALRRRNEPDAALAALAQAAEISGVSHGGVPADLLARWGRCDLFEHLGRETDLQREAAALYDDLSRGTWEIDRAAYELHLADAERWRGTSVRPGTPPDPVRLAVAVESLWRAWQDGRPSGRDALAIDGSGVTLLWQTSGTRFTGIAAGPAFVDREWLSKLMPLAESQGVRVSLHDRAQRGGSATAARRTAGETGLPWTVVVETRRAEGDGERFTAAQRLWVAGLAVLALLVASGTYVIGRAVSRELAIARLQTDFVAAVSHEFRTPLTSLRQLTEMLIDRPHTPEDRRRTYYDALARQTERLHRLVESLLDFGRMEAGRSPYRIEPLDAAVLVRSVVRQFESEAAGRGCCVELRVVSGATIAGDREALTNALWNLLDNAVKYSPEQPTVSVEVEADAASLAIRVRDRGLGIPRHEQQEIFHKFVRGANAKVENIQGTGIGLAIVHHVVKAHRGEVTVESEPGAGSTFTVRLPRQGAHEEVACLEF